jgi:hypothetical protein
MSAPAGLPLVLCLSILVQYKLTQIPEDIGDHRALVLWGDHQNQVSKHLGDLERYIRNIDLRFPQVAFQKVMDLAVDAIGHLISLYCQHSRPSGRRLTASGMSGVEHMHRFDIPSVEAVIENVKLLSS